MFKARGKLAILNDGKMREITVDKGRIHGDEMLKFELLYVLKDKERHGEGIMPAMYFPSGKYHEDELAVLLTLRNICDGLQLNGDIPELPYEEGLIY